MYSIDSKRSKNMLYDIIGWVYGIWAIAFFVYAVIWNIDGCALKANAAIQYSAGGETAGLAATVISR